MRATAEEAYTARTRIIDIGRASKMFASTREGFVITICNMLERAKADSRLLHYEMFSKRPGGPEVDIESCCKLLDDDFAERTVTAALKILDQAQSTVPEYLKAPAIAQADSAARWFYLLHILPRCCKCPQLAIQQLIQSRQHPIENGDYYCFAHMSELTKVCQFEALPWAEHVQALQIMSQECR